MLYDIIGYSLIMLFMCSKHLQSGNVTVILSTCCVGSLLSICSITYQRILAIRFMTCSFCSIFHHRSGYQWTNGCIEFDRLSTHIGYTFYDLFVL